MRHLKAICVGLVVLGAAFSLVMAGAQFPYVFGAVLVTFAAWLIGHGLLGSW